MLKDKICEISAKEGAYLNVFDISEPCVLYYILKDQSKKHGKDQETTQSSTTPDPGHHMGK